MVVVVVTLQLYGGGPSYLNEFSSGGASCAAVYVGDAIYADGTAGA
jgi:hypothetical protein